MFAPVVLWHVLCQYFCSTFKSQFAQDGIQRFLLGADSGTASCAAQRMSHYSDHFVRDAVDCNALVLHTANPHYVTSILNGLQCAHEASSTTLLGFDQCLETVVGLI